MTRSIVVVTLAAGIAVACSRPDPSQAPQRSAAQEPAAQTTTTPPRTPDATSGAAATTGSVAPQEPTPPPRPAPARPDPAPQPPPPPAAPKFRDVTVPAGTELSVTVLSTLASDASKAEDPVKGALAKPVVVDGTTVLPKGATLSGMVTEAKESGRIKGKASIAFTFERMVVRGETYPIHTAVVTQQAAQKKSDDVKKGGVGAGLGAIVGGVVGGGKGAAIGAVAGGTTGVLATKGNEIQVAPGTVVTALLQEPLTVPIRVK